MPNQLIVPGGRPPAAEAVVQPEAPSGPVAVTTAFVVYQHGEYGTWEATNNLDVSLEKERVATNDDLTAACAILFQEGGGSWTNPGDTLKVITAFVLYQLPSGLWQVSDELDIPLMPARMPHTEEVLGAYAVTLRDAQTREIMNLISSQIVPAIGQNVVQTQLQFGAAMRQAHESGELAAALEKDRINRAGGR